MHIELEQRGGAVGFVPGLARPITVATDELSPEQRQQLDQLVDQAGLADLPGGGQAETHPNVPSCRLCVETDQGDRYDVRLAETAIPSNTRPLIEWLRKYSEGH